LTGIATKDPGDVSGTYDHHELVLLKEQIMRFTQLSPDQKDQMITLITSLAERNFHLASVKNLFSTLKSEEGVIALRMLERFKTSITPVELKREGVHRPLMSGYTPGKEDLEIFLPENLERYADYGIILELLRYKGLVPRVRITRCTGEVKIQNEERLSQLIMGYISELLSNQQIVKISYTKSSYYQLGRMLARAKLMQFVCADSSIPMKYVQVPPRFLGGTTEFQEPESIRTLKSLISGDVELIDDLLKNLASHIYKVWKDQVRQKISACLFTAFPEFVHMFERRARVQSKKGRGGKIKSSFTTIKATKPSTLSTIAPWERDAVQELYDSPWPALQQLEKEYESTHPLDLNYVSFAKKISDIISEQWTNKQIVLRKTNHRLVVSGLDDSTPLWQRLNKVRTILAEFKSIETCDRSTLRRIVVAYDILPTGLITVSDGFRKSWVAAFKDGDLSSQYPATTRLILAYQENVTSGHVEDST
jgi:hypothetical protein